ncbi:MAG: ATP synthase F0 subunit B [Deltaproteobacteria bacterium]|nr:ATP synthase F0 subunit B [Deltaproteobacteria bacterium]MBW1951716.1 ATP synthase F0 subunit B [Deltaproteobacteria bacterium]MBW1987262.1 ATP synthase F0 subunit B [Deltaproteobacteria bacterium]MBW2134729.1 ATP synthase F0 subunit B [Deltaproteobacteria bacterium]
MSTGTGKGIGTGFGVALTLAGMVLMVGVAWAAEAGHGGGEHDAARIKDLIWRTVNFVVFAGILIKLATKPIKEFFAGRKQQIAQNLEELESQKAAAEKALAEAQARLATVAEEREKIIKIFIAEGEAEKARIIERAEQAAARIKEMAALTIEAETKKAAADLKRELVETAAQLSEGLIKEHITADDQQRLVDEYLTKVVEAH